MRLSHLIDEYSARFDVRRASWPTGWYMFARTTDDAYHIRKGVCWSVPFIPTPGDITAADWEPIPERKNS